MSFINIIRFPLLLLAMVLITVGCATKHDMYYWGEYEQLIYNSYVNPGVADPQTQIQQITTDIQQSESVGKKTPPGVFAHLGYLYAMEGNVAQSKEAFLEERARYPESSAFIDGMLNRAKLAEEKQR